ncbi:MAG: FHA domain-containing protein [Chromatiaceae bacterium]|nr:FHA domain-containing protein [Chromatiaceae bacterium]
MPQIHLIADKKRVSTFDLADGEVVVGRGTDCEIQLDDDAISRRHVRIFTLMGDAFLEDLESSNGTYVNGCLTRKSVLNDGDVIQIGQRELLFTQPADDRSSLSRAGEADATMIIPPGNFGPATVAAKQQNRSRDGISPVAFSVRESGKRLPKETPYEAQEMDNGGFWGWLLRFFR